MSRKIDNLNTKIEKENPFAYELVKAVQNMRTFLQRKLKNVDQTKNKMELIENSLKSIKNNPKSLRNRPKSVEKISKSVNHTSRIETRGGYFKLVHRFVRFS